MTDFVKLVLDADTRGLKDAERDLKGLSREAGMTAQNIGKSMQKLGLGLTAGVTAPLALFGKSAFNAAVDAQEMESAFDVVFGNMAADVRAWAEATGDAMGRSTQEIQRGALAFQELFGKSLAPEAASELSKEFAVLTQDLASFKNLSNEVAQQKLFSGLVGEAEPLRAVGVFLNEAAVQAKAAELGIGGVNGKLTDQEKIIARAAIIREQLAQAEGDVLRTSESTANQIKASQAAFEELQITIGTKLLPALTPLIAGFGSALETFTNLPDPVQNTALAIGGIALVLGPVLTVLGTLVTLAPAIATGLGLIKAASLALMTSPPILAFAAVVTGIYLAWQNWDKIEPYITAVGDAVSDFWQNRVKPVFDLLGHAIVTAITWWQSLKQEGINAIQELGASLWEGGKQIVSSMYSIGRDIVAGIVEGIKAAPEAVWNALKSVVSSGVTRIREYLGINSPSLLFMEMGGFITEGLAIGIESGKGLVGDAAQSLADEAQVQSVRVVKTFEDMARGVTNTLRNLGSAIKSGGFLDILGSVIDLGLQLGSVGLFGSKIQGNINAPSFDGGGYTGSGSRSGGLDGKGGFAAILHPNETVIDHTRRANNDSTRIMVGIDPRNGNVTAYVDNRIGASAPAIATGGARLAQREMQRAQSRSVRG